jgi:hypothetical protein
MRQVGFINKSIASPRSARHVAQSCTRIHYSREVLYDSLNFVSNGTAIIGDPQGYNRNLIWDHANRITGIKISGFRWIAYV